MIRTTILISALLTTGTLLSQTSVTVSTAASNGQQKFYSLANGEVATMDLASWDLAFEITGFTASIRVNTQKGMRVFKAPYPVSQWSALDTTGMLATWVEAFDSDTSWSHGALNNGLTTNEFDLGWGVYNPITHIVAGDSLFVLQLADGSWKKLRIDALATSVYTFTHADLDGSNEQVGNVTKSMHSGRNFGYFSFATNSSLDPEPASLQWDLLFTKYTGFVPSAYPVTGVLHNKGVEVLQLDGVDPAMADWTSAPFSSHINIIGSDWKTFNMQTFQYEYPQDRTYFVRDLNGNIWKLVFTGYGGSANGDIVFTQELVSATGIPEPDQVGTIKVFPTVVQDGRLNMLIDVPARSADLTVLDMGGRVLRSERLQGIDGMSVRQLDMSGTPAGVHVLQVRTEDRVHTARFIVE